MSVNVKTMNDFDLSGKRVMIRSDLNVPFDGDRISDDTRIRASLPTIAAAKEAGAAVIVLSHRGRPKEGQYDESLSLKPIADYMTELAGFPVRFEKDWLGGVDIAPGDVVLCENVRFNPGEKADDEALSKTMAQLCDVFIMDAFGTAHRAQATTHGIARFADNACAGPLLMAELDALEQALSTPKRPMVAIVGGSKVSTKLTLLETLVTKVDQLIVGGGIANTFIAAAGFDVGKSLYEPDLVDVAKRLIDQSNNGGCSIPVPTDVVCGKKFDASEPAVIKSVSDVEPDDLILDIGPESAKNLAALLGDAGTIIWNGPVGVFEIDQFGKGTETLSNAIAESSAFSIAGGGDTLAAISKYGVTDQVSYISTGGGAFLEYVEGKVLPAVAALEAKAAL